MIRRTPRSTLFPYTTLFFFFFNDTATTEIYTLSLHDALPIFPRFRDALTPYEFVSKNVSVEYVEDRKSTRLNSSHTVISYAVFCLRTKEHTSELQSHSDLVCRLLLETKNSHASTRVSMLSRTI